MAHALIITAAPSGGLTYSDNDVVQVLDGHLNPGGSVTGTSSGFAFVYVSDKEHDDPDVLALMAPWEGDLIDPNDPDMRREQLGKRRYTVTLADAAHLTWVDADSAEAAAITKTWAEIQALTGDKAAV
jgi:hypothetical protein